MSGSCATGMTLSSSNNGITIDEKKRSLVSMPAPTIFRPVNSSSQNRRLSTTDSGFGGSATELETGNSSSAKRTSGPIDLNYELPRVVASVRDGWSATCQSGAVVSGLLAAVAAQMLSLFKAPPTGPNGGQTVLLVSCYLAILLNISATIGSFIIIDRLGEIYFKSSSNHPVYQKESIGGVIRSQEQLMVDYNASKMWKPLLYYWLLTFFAGILSLVIAILTYITMQENLAVKVTIWIMVFIHLALLLFFVMSNAVRDE